MKRMHVSEKFDSRTAEVIKLACLTVWIIVMATASGCAHSGRYNPDGGYDQFIHGR